MPKTHAMTVRARSPMHGQACYEMPSSRSAVAVGVADTDSKWRATSIDGKRAGASRQAQWTSACRSHGSQSRLAGFESHSESPAGLDYSKSRESLAQTRLRPSHGLRHAEVRDQTGERTRWVDLRDAKTQTRRRRRKTFCGVLMQQAGDAG